MATSTASLSSPAPMHRVMLPSLMAVPMKPKWRCDVPNISSPLLRIEHVEVIRSPTQDASSRDTSYKIRVYYEEPSSRIPTYQVVKTRTRSKQASSSFVGNVNRAPALTVERTVSQFASLRDSIHSCVHMGLQGCTCDFCEQLRGFLVHGSARPLAFARLAMDPGSDASVLLGWFLTRLLDDSRAILESGRRQSCRGQMRIPYLLYRFLEPTSSSQPDQE